jgi:DNA (cytosine-5)-methyltransferase 1
MKSIELFAGAGGMALGLENSGFDTIGLIEFDKNAVATLKQNRPNWNIIHDDITKISSQDLTKLFNIQEGELDLLSGGAPCQSFSYAGKRLGLDDTRGTLFYHFAVFLRKLKPKVFLFENVKGLLTHDNCQTFNTILNVSEDCGYSVQYKVLNAWDYGVAQKRERLIVIGIRNDLELKIDFPKPLEDKLVLADILQNVPDSDGAKYSKQKYILFEFVPQGGCWKDISHELAKEYMKNCYKMSGGKTGILRRLSMDEPALTIMTTPQQKQTDRCHPIETRPLTIRESARCQSFPDDWQFCGSIANQYKQIGNAVPVLMAEKIASKLRDSW